MISERFCGASIPSLHQKSFYSFQVVGKTQPHLGIMLHKPSKHVFATNLRPSQHQPIWFPATNLFLVPARILPFFGTHTDQTLFLYSPGQFFDTRSDSIFSGYSPRFHYFSILTLIRPFSGTSPHSFSILGQILPFSGARPDSTIFRYSLIRPLFGARRDSFSILAQIRHFLGTRPDSTIFQYSHSFDTFSVLAVTVFRYSHGFYLFPVLARFYHFSVLTLIRPFSSTRPHSFSILGRILPFPGTRSDSTISRYSH